MILFIGEEDVQASVRQAHLLKSHTDRPNNACQCKPRSKNHSRPGPWRVVVSLVFFCLTSVQTCVWVVGVAGDGSLRSSEQHLISISTDMPSCSASEGVERMFDFYDKSVIVLLQFKRALPSCIRLGMCWEWFSAANLNEKVTMRCALHM